MDKIDKYIDELFRDKLSEPELTDSFSDKEWNKLEKDIKTKNFFSFRPGSFNFYYLTFAISAIIFFGTFYMLNKPANETPKEKNNNISIETNNNQSNKNDTLKDENQKTDSIYILKIDSVLTDSIKDIIKTTCQITVKNDSCEIEKEPKDTNIEKIITNIQQIKPLQERVKYQPAKSISDTIYQVDTIRITKKRLKFKRK
jgi:type III secretory pathway component EscV